MAAIERQLIRDRARRRVRIQRRRMAAVAVLTGPFVAAALLVGAGGNGASGTAGAAAQAARALAPPTLPGGGRRIFPEHRVVAFYGAPQEDDLGVLGIGSPAEAGRRLARQARAYRSGGRRVMPAFELIATVAQAVPGEDGKYRHRQEEALIRTYLAAARRAGALLLLDIQPGREDFMTEVRAFRRFLEEPDVGIALDPEWHMGSSQVPGQQLGSVTAAKVNEIASYLAEIVRDGDLPEKLLVVHQFTEEMLSDPAELRTHPGVALTINVDGFGDRAVKLAKYRELAPQGGPHHRGLKLFYREDTDMMRPADVLRLRPVPDMVSYE